MAIGVREITRDVVRAQLAEALCDVFLAQGFDETTVEDAARAVGISRATFFRYFPSKDDAVIAAIHKSDFADEVRALEPVEGESTWQLLRRVFDQNVREAEKNPPRLLALVKMISGSSSLRSQLARRRIDQQGAFADALAERLNDPFTAKVFVVTSLAAFDLAWREWSEHPERPLGVVVDAVFVRLQRA